MEGICRDFRVDPEIQGQSFRIDLVLHSHIPYFLVIERQKCFALNSHSDLNKTPGFSVLNSDSEYGEV